MTDISGSAPEGLTPHSPKTIYSTLERSTLRFVITTSTTLLRKAKPLSYTAPLMKCRPI
ncbi:hypothetical protein SERLADRAFT_454707 [Serpula lacrymans var. lacrymans S7.9]|uniref:Uncharacterized protein n=1 Tax=Serpula lacrymans var. lacrymans (strain S7.9) TaxID=578457 RepID=F8NE51_SERL9|nr:uncharacterized protein SERLADRAFT_454707 [Serpula lacrymans var. lacrymans S7.9]EGO30380.1 hypothetical protein SERLADRAFT_454707 [Serpula lacrymans var. lacrymans S7.9]